MDRQTDRQTGLGEASTWDEVPGIEGLMLCPARPNASELWVSLSSSWVSGLGSGTTRLIPEMPAPAEAAANTEVCKGSSVPVHIYTPPPP